MHLPADIHLIDEPSANQDSAQRIVAAKVGPVCIQAGSSCLTEACSPQMNAAHACMLAF